MYPLIERVVNDDNDQIGWKKFAIKQGYLIEFQSGKESSLKMHYFVLTKSGLISFEQQPMEETKPLRFFPYEQLSTINLEQFQLSSITLFCIYLKSKRSTGFTLCFNCKSERDDWLMLMMTSFLETLAVTNTSYVERDEEKEIGKHKKEMDSSQNCCRLKRRKGPNGSIRTSKLNNTLEVENGNGRTQLNDSENTLTKPLMETENISNTRNGRKRKSDQHRSMISRDRSFFQNLNENKKALSIQRNINYSTDESKTHESKQKCSIFKRFSSRFRLHTNPSSN